MGKDLVLVTGGSGFIGTHCIVQLLNAGYSVRTTVRSLGREAGVRTMVDNGGAEGGNALSFVAADLMADTGWAEAAADCRYVLHVASPFPIRVPKHEDELIVPAREGTLRVLRASRAAGVQRVVLTSSIAAVTYGHPPRQAPFTESDWTDTDSRNMSAYVRSKALAERAAWDFLAREGGNLELSSVNPVGVFGPALGDDDATSLVIVKYMMNGTLPAFPRIRTGVVDVRDVADLHLRAMTSPAANGERFIAIADRYIPLLEIGSYLRQGLGAAARRVPTRELPDWLLRFVSRFDPNTRAILPELGSRKDATGEKARRLLGWSPRSSKEAILASAESLIRFGLLKDSPKKVAATH